jgi:CRISPR/Cas system endoribonuclease Cas6 (RAMP superfamily)
LEKHIEPFAQYAVSVLLSSAQLKRIETQSTPKKDNPDRIQFAGYTGKLTFTGNFNYYLPLLLFIQNIGVGSNTTYGLGQFRIVEF